MFTQNKYMVYFSYQHPCTYLRKTMLYNISNELNASLCSDLISFQSIQSTWDSVCKNNAGQANIRAPNLYVGTAILQFVGNNSVYNCFFPSQYSKIVMALSYTLHTPGYKTLDWHLLDICPGYSHCLLQNADKAAGKKKCCEKRKSFHSFSAKAAQ